MAVGAPYPIMLAAPLNNRPLARAALATTIVAGGAAIILLIRRQRRLAGSAKSARAARPDNDNNPFLSPETKKKREVGQSARPARARDELTSESVLHDIEAEGLQQLMVLPGSRGQALAACSLMLEPKFLRGGAQAAHLTEQFVRGGRMRAELLRQLVELARDQNCYKAILDAPPSDGPTLRAIGFEERGLTLVAELEGGGDGSGQGGAGSRSIARVVPLSSPRTLCVPRRGDDAAAPSGSRGPSTDFVLRNLSDKDGSDRYLSLLRQLSHAPPLPEIVFLGQLERVRQANGMHLVLVVEAMASTSSDATEPPAPLVGCATLLFERIPVPGACASILRGGSGADGALVARIEDVVVDESTRGTGLGRALLKELLGIARERGAACATLNCSPSNEGFYAKCGFRRPPNGDVCYGVYMGLPGSASHATMA